MVSFSPNVFLFTGHFFPENVSDRLRTPPLSSDLLGKFYALHKTELLYRNSAKSLKLAPFWCSYPLRQSPTGEVEK